MSPFGRKTQFKMAATCTNYYAENSISSPITMQVVNAIYGFVCLEGQGILISLNKTHLKRFFFHFKLAKTILPQQLFW